MPIHGNGDQLRAWRQAMRLKQQEIADHLGIGRSNYANLESGQSIPERIYQQLLMMGFDRVKPAMGLANMRGEPVGLIKVYGSISAGDGNASAVDTNEIEVPIQFARQDYGGLVADGMSMFPMICPGDTIIFCDSTTPRLGYVFACELPGGEWVVKLLAESEGQIVLRSLNPAYPDMSGQYRLAGYLVGIIHDDGPERTIRLNAHGLKP